MMRVAKWLVERPRIVLVAALVLTVLLGVETLQLRIESSLDSVLPHGDPAVTYYEKVREQFGSDDVAVVGVLADDVFAPGTIEKIDRVTKALQKIDGVETVLSITNAPDPAADVFLPPKLMPRVPPTPEDLAALRAKLDATPLYRQNLLSEDYRGAAINMFLKALTAAQYEDLDVDGQVMRLLAAESGPERFYYTGAAHLTHAAVASMRRDILQFTPIALIFVIVVLWASFPSKRGVLLPFVSVILALVWTLGVLVLAGKAITLGTFVLPPLLLVIGASYAIHVMARYYEEAELGGTRGEVTLRAFDRVWRPLCISAFTNSVGFAALMVNRIPAIWELGLFASVGVWFLLLSSLTVLPAVLAMLPVERAAVRAAGGTPRLDRVLAGFARLAFTHRRAVIWGSVAMSLIALFGVRRIDVDADYLYYFDPEAEVRQANEVINQEIVGSNPFYLVIDGEKGAFRHWENLLLMKDLQDFVETLPGVTASASIVDYLELLERGLNKSTGGDLVVGEDGKIAPATPPKPFWQDPKNLAPVLKMVEASPDTFTGVVTPDFSRASILVQTRLAGSRSVENTLEAIDDYVGARFPASLPVKPTGSLVLLNGSTKDIVRGQIESLVLALGMIFIVMALMFLSWKIGFLAIIPNALAILIFFGIMGWLGILLNLGTSLIAAIALGLAVDSTIHYMARLNREVRGESDQAAAIERALRTVGVPIIYTALALFLGFLTFAFSGFVPIQNFGILSSATLAVALGANLLLLPAVLAQTKIITIWDLIGLRLGQQPENTIPLFAGLRRSQARVVVLMGELRKFEPGEAIVRQGEEGDQMFVIIQGRTEVYVDDGKQRRYIRDLVRGDVFGEMALVRQAPRTADIVAATRVEALAVDQRFLDRIQRRYPRIASRVFLNLTKILSDRLQSTTQQFVAAQRTAGASA
jgi:predicted RND superfamily exporter protein